MIINPTRIKAMSTEQLKWFVDIGEAGLKGSWKGHKLEALCKKAMKDIKAELKKRAKKGS